ncbi:unnamed protein product [Staurois parvus]|uniref:Uncharacterized protein n=1 Tax=Staurois parvus TaxID=386267 RepID=A0ABN9ESC7_9NEOB|nr:unnamed protein product [Staurois parvus]
MGDARNLPAPYIKKIETHQQCEGRPESGHMAECGDGVSSKWGRRTGTHDRLWTTWQQA